MFTKILKVVSLTLIVILIVSGCAGKTEGPKRAENNKNNTSAEQLNIVTSFYPIYLHTINITKNIPDVSVVNMTEPQTRCLHDYSITTEDMKKLENAHIFVINGAGMEAFMDKVVKQLPDLKIVEASMDMELIGQQADKHKKDEEKEENEEELNAHVWVSISGAIEQVQNIAEQLAVLDPEHAQQYRDNTRLYVKKLEDLRERMHNELDPIKNKNIVTFHEAFPYFAKEFNLNIKAVIEREPGTEPSAQELAETIQIIKKSKVKALFAEPQYSAKAAETIAKETGLKIYILDPVVTGEANGDTDAYIKAMEKNLETLKEALK